MKNHYLFHIRFLGFRYHGWLKQPGYKTVQLMVEKTLEFVFGHGDFKTLGCSRTDAKVSANHFVFELFCQDKIDPVQFFAKINKHLPNDIEVLKIEETTADFNIIQQVSSKEYLYFFAHGQKNHPFCAPQIMTIAEHLNLDLMNEGAKLYLGKNNFRRYCAEPKEHQQFYRTVDVCEIVTNNSYQANFFPEESYFFKVCSQGFLRYQVRLMMGTLFALGSGELKLDDVRRTLDGSSEIPVRHIAPSSGLILNKVTFRPATEQQP